MALDPAAATLLGTVVGGAIGVAGKALSDLISLRKDREAMQYQRRSEQEKWQREQMVTRLSESAKLLNLYITKSLGRSLEQRQNDPDIQEASAEAERALVALVLVYPDKSNEHYEALVTQIDKSMWKAVPEIDDVWPIRQLIVKLAVKLGSESFVGSVKKT